jgi:hypothetical protein
VKGKQGKRRRTLRVAVPPRDQAVHEWDAFLEPSPPLFEMHDEGEARGGGAQGRGAVEEDSRPSTPTPHATRHR